MAPTKFIIKKKNVLSWFMAILMFVLITPEGVIYIYSGMDRLLKGGVVLIICMHLVLSLVYKRCPSKATVILLAFNIWLITATYLYKSDALSTAILNGMRVMSLCMVFDYYKNSIQTLLDACRIYYIVIIFINFLTICFFYPNGIERRLDGTAVYFLGYKNAFILYFLPALYFSLLEFYRRKKGFILMLVYLMCLISALLEKSSTTILALIVSLLVFLWIDFRSRLSNNIGKPRRGLYLVVAIYLFFNAALLSLEWITESEWAIFFVEKIMGKSITFTGRTNIWLTAIELIKCNPIWGYGVGSNVSYGGTIWYGHNMIIEILLEGGVVALAIFSAVIMLLLQTTKKSKAIYYNSLFVILSALFVYFLTEANTLQHFVPVYIVGCNVDKYKMDSQETSVCNAKQQLH